MKNRSTWVEIDLDAFSANLRVIRREVGEQVQIHLVVKADAYGHGAGPIGRIAETEGVHSLGVATLDEGIELRRDGIRIPVIILSPTLAPEAGAIVEHDLTATVADSGIARALSARARAAGREIGVQLEIDTGMGRTGLPPADAVSFAAALAEMPGIRLTGTYTHFPRADSPDGVSMTSRQFEDLLATADALRAAGLSPGLLHAANSAGLVNHAGSRLDMVRPGLLAYGLTPSSGVVPPQGLSPVMRLASRLVHVRELGPGHPVSYGGEFVTPQTMRVGTAAIGYGHGLPFRLSGRGAALCRGCRVPILGRVTMDTTVFDLRGVPEAKLGDEITLFGRQGDEEIRVERIAETTGTIPYEILCGIGRRVARVYTRVGQTVGERTLLGTMPPLLPKTEDA
ncbi:MAG: alanine racemase [Gemmatimonadota bacterium]|nr:alanine racemase [Gemmatimonadota bacterium]MDP6803473.1 alanine racemase [Gemmatimonadota bacterium]MDP7032595.1 alanine racemase [Gemmatimonadota bacterium]